MIEYGIIFALFLTCCPSVILCVGNQPDSKELNNFFVLCGRDPSMFDSDTQEFFLSFMERYSIDVRNEMGKTPLMHIASFGEYLAMERLIFEYGADISLVDNGGHNLEWHITRPMEILQRGAARMSKARFVSRHDAYEHCLAVWQRALPRNRFNDFCITGEQLRRLAPDTE